jgi:uncharacterized membrane protein YidH (DUF202 family)
MAVIYEPSNSAKRFYGIFLLILGILLFIYGLTMVNSIYEWQEDRWVLDLMNLIIFLIFIGLSVVSMLLGLKLLRIFEF